MTGAREEPARILHDANTGKICPDPEDPTKYGAMAKAVLDAGYGKVTDDPKTVERIRRAIKRAVLLACVRDDGTPASEVAAVAAIRALRGEP